MRRAVVVCWVLAACGGDEKLPTGPITAQVTHYDLAFDLDSRAAKATVTATVTTGGDCLTLPFRGQDLTAATLDGAAASATVDATSLTACGRGWKAGDTVTLETEHTLALATLSASQVGYSTKNDGSGNPYDYLLSWVDECDRFMPCDHRANQFATFTFDVTHPAATTVRCPGTVTDVSATETTCDFAFDGGPTYSIGVIASPAWTPTDLGTWAGVHVTLYDRAATGTAAAIDPAYHTGFVTWMQSQFGPWPYGSELRVLTAPTYWDGFEHPGNIVLADSLGHATRSAYMHPVEHILDHEITHMWAGNQTTLADTYDFVWKEAMAEYLAYVYEDMADPTAAPQTAAYWKNASAGALYFPVPGEKPALFDYYGDAYGPGPMVLFRQLEVLTSRDQVLAALRSVLGHPHAISVDDVVAALSQSTGLDLTAYAAAWIHGTGKPAWPTVMLTFTPGATTSTLTVHQATAPERRCKFHVGLDGSNAGEQTLVAVDTYNGGTDQTLTVPTPAYSVTSVVLDPLAECLVYGAGFAAPPRFNPWLAH